MSKLIKSRGEYKCNGCEGTIAKGDLYSRRSKRLGSSKQDTVERTESGGIVFVSHGITVSLEYCLKCTTGSDYNVLNNYKDWMKKEEVTS